MATAALTSGLPEKPPSLPPSGPSTTTPASTSLDGSQIEARSLVLKRLLSNRLQNQNMAPTPQRRTVPKDRFAQLFGTLKTQTYHDPAARGPGSHTLRTISWNPTGLLIATGSADKTLRIWNPERANVKYSTELRGHISGIEKVAFNPVKESELASCSSDGTVRFWDVRSKNCVSKVDVGGEAFTLAWAGDGSVLVVGRKDDTLIPISLPTYTAQPAHPQPLQTNATTFSHHTPPTDILLTTGDGTINLLSYPSFHPLHTLHAHTSACLSLTLSPNGKYLAVGGSDALISLWDTYDWVCRRTVSSSNGGAIRGVSWSFDGRFVVGASDEVGIGGGGGGGGGALEIFHAETGESVFTVPVQGGGGGVPACAWHPGRYWLAYSVAEGVGVGSGGGGLRIVGAAGGSL